MTQIQTNSDSPTDSQSDANKRMYHGFTGAVSYASLVIAIAASASAVGAIVIWQLTRRWDLTQQFALRLMCLSAASGLCVAIAAWLTGWRSPSLFYFRVHRADWVAMLGLTVGYASAYFWIQYSAPISSQGQSSVIKTLEIQGPTINDQDFDLADMQGKVLLVDFWATWCGPCIAELPNVRKVYDKYHEHGLDVVGISLDENKAALKAFLQEHDEPWPQIFYEEQGKTGFSNPLAVKHGINAIPAIYLIDRQGNLLAGNLRGEKMELEIAKALDRPAPFVSLQSRIQKALFSLAMGIFVSVMQGTWWLAITLSIVATTILAIVVKPHRSLSTTTTN